MRGAVSVDHLHLLVSAPPQIAPSKRVHYLKGRSSRKLQEEFPSLRKRYWGQPLWARGCFCAAVGAVDEETIKRHTEEQKRDADGEGLFRIVGGGAESLKSALQPKAFQAALAASGLSILPKPTSFSW